MFLFILGPRGKKIKKLFFSCKKRAKVPVAFLYRFGFSFFLFLRKKRTQILIAFLYKSGFLFIFLFLWIISFGDHMMWALCIIWTTLSLFITTKHKLLFVSKYLLPGYWQHNLLYCFINNIANLHKQNCPLPSQPRMITWPGKKTKKTGKTEKTKNCFSRKKQFFVFWKKRTQYQFFFSKLL